MPQINLSCEEKKAYEYFKKSFDSDLPPKLLEDPFIFHRFLKARDFDVIKAEKLLRKHLHYRKAHQIDTLLEDFKAKEVYCKFVEPTVFGIDKEGDPIAYFCIGKINAKALFRSIKMNEYIMHFVWTTEKCVSFMKSFTKKEGSHMWQGTMIFDLDTVTFSNTTDPGATDALLRLLHVCQNNYPEYLNTVYFINAPSFFVMVFNFFKSFMSNVMARKFHIFGQSGWKEKLLEQVDADVLPDFLGGNRTDPDGNPLCKTFLVHGGKPPPQYYLSNEDRYFKNTDEVKKIIIPKLGKKEVDVDVTESGSLIKWKFLVKWKDIGFGLSFATSDQEVKEILPIERYVTSDGTEEYFYKTKCTGKYIIIFDNSYSWLISKEIEYCLEVVKPEKEI